MGTTLAVSEEIIAEVTSWQGVDAGPGRRGEFAFRVGRREIGHLHGDRAAHFVFPRAAWLALESQGRIVPQLLFATAQGPAARVSDDEADGRDVIALLRLNDERATSRHPLAAEARA